MGLRYKCELQEMVPDKIGTWWQGILGFQYAIRQKCAICGKKEMLAYLMTVKVKRKKDKGKKVMTRICINCLNKIDVDSGGERFEAVFKKGTRWFNAPGSLFAGPDAKDPTW